MRKILWQDPALGNQALLLRIGLPLLTVAAGWRTATASLAASESEGIAPGLLAVFAICTAFLWAVTLGPLGQGRVRVFEYQLSLPISARTLVGMRLAAHLLPGLVLYALLIGALVWLDPSSPIIKWQRVVQLVAFASAWTFFALLLFAWRPDRPRIDSSRAYFGFASLGAVALALPFFAPRFSLVLTLGGAVGLASHLWRRVPHTMHLSGALASAHESTASERTATREQPGSLHQWILRRTLFRGRFLILAACAFYFSLSSQWHLGSILFQLPMLVLTTLWLLRISAGILRDVGHLPIRRRTLAAWILLPSVVLLFAGTLAGQLLDGSWSTWDFRRQVRLHFPFDGERGPELWNLRVPGELLQLQWGTEPLLVESPAGETAVLEPTPILWGFPLQLLNPYEVQQENSEEFIAWQLSRAFEEAYGISIAPETLRANYLVRKRFNSYHFNKDYPDVEVKTYPMGQLIAGLSLSALLWFLALVLFTAERIPPRNRAQWRGRVAARGILGALALASLTASYAYGIRHDLIHSALRRTLDRWLEAWMTSHPFAGILLGVVALAALYGFAMRQMERLEIPARHPGLDAEEIQHLASS